MQGEGGQGLSGAHIVMQRGPSLTRADVVWDTVIIAPSCSASRVGKKEQT